MIKRKNVCIISYDLISGGSELNAKKIINHIENNYFWVSLSRKKKKEFLKIKNLKKTFFLNFTITRFFTALLNLEKFIQKNKIDIIYAIGLYPSVLASILKFKYKFKLIITRRGVINLLEFLKYFYFFIFIYFSTDKIETNSKKIFNRFKLNFFLKNKVYLTNNFVEDRIFKGPYKKIIENKKTILGFALNIRPVKDPKLIKQIIEVVHKNTNFKFLVVGRDKDNFWNNLSKKYKKRVIWFNSLNHNKLINFYKTIDFLLITSKSEGSPNTVVEAMSNSKSTISVPIGATDGLIINNYNGIISENRSPDKFFKAIIKANKNKNRLSKNSKLFFQKNFNLEKNINKLKEYF